MTTQDIIDKFGAIASRTILTLQKTGSEKLRQFASDIDSTGVSFEKLQKIAEKAGVDVNNIAEAFDDATGTAEALGLTSTDLTVALLGYAKAGIEGQDASDLFKKSMIKLSEEARGLGIDVEKADGSLLSLREIIEALGADTLTSQEILEKFGPDVAKSVEILTKDGTEGFNQLTESVVEFAGAAEGAGAAMQETKVDTLSGDLKILTSAFDGLKTAIFELGLGDVLRSIVQGVTTLIEEGNKFVEANSEAISTFFDNLSTKIPQVIASLQPKVIPVLQAIGKGFSDMANRTVELVSKFAGSETAITSIFTSIASVAGAVRGGVF